MNVGQFVFNLGEAALNLAEKLYLVFTSQVSIKWVQTIFNFFGTKIDLPEYISLSYLLTGASAILILTLIIYRLVK